MGLAFSLNEKVLFKCYFQTLNLPFSKKKNAKHYQNGWNFNLRTFEFERVALDSLMLIIKRESAMFGQRREYACFRDEGQLLISELPFFNFFNSMLKKEWFL